MKEIGLTQGKSAIVDDGMYEFLKNYKWHAVKSSHKIPNYYASTSIWSPEKRKMQEVKLHHVIIGQSLIGLHVDHRNCNSLDDRKGNLRFVTPRENSSNRRLHVSGRKVGAVYEEKNKRWQAKIMVNGKTIHIGWFKVEDEAADAYQRKLKEVVGC